MNAGVVAGMDVGTGNDAVVDAVDAGVKARRRREARENDNAETEIVSGCEVGFEKEIEDATGSVTGIGVYSPSSDTFHKTHAAD